MHLEDNILGHFNFFRIGFVYGRVLTGFAMILLGLAGSSPVFDWMEVDLVQFLRGTKT